MAVSNDDLVELIRRLPQSAKKAAFDYLKYLTESHNRPSWNEIADLEPDGTPLSEEEERQLKRNSEFVSWEDAMNELSVPTDTKP